MIALACHYKSGFKFQLPLQIMSLNFNCHCKSGFKFQLSWFHKNTMILQVYIAWPCFITQNRNIMFITMKYPSRHLWPKMVLARALMMLRRGQQQYNSSEDSTSDTAEAFGFEWSDQEDQDNNLGFEWSDQCQDEDQDNNQKDNEVTRETDNFSDMSGEDEGEILRGRALKILLHERGHQDDESASVIQTKAVQDDDLDSVLSFSEDDIQSRAMALKSLLKDRDEKVRLVKRELNRIWRQKKKEQKRQSKMIALKELKAIEKKKAKPSSKFSLILWRAKA